MAEPFWDIERDGVTQSMLGLFMSCPQKAAVKLKLGMEVQGNYGMNALNFGDFFHRGLDTMYCMSKDSILEGDDSWKQDLDNTITGVVHGLYLEDKKKLHDAGAPPQSFTSLEMMSGMCDTLLQQYFRRWFDDFSNYDWVDLERVFEVPYTLRLPFRDDTGFGVEEITVPLRGKYDGVFRDKRGKLWLFETKTKSSIDDSSIAEKLNFDLQVMMYLYTMRHVYGETPMGVIYNLVKRPALRQGKTESMTDYLGRIELDVLSKPDAYFTRYTATILPQELDEWLENDFQHMVRQMYEWSKGNFNYRNTTSCYMWMKPCEFMRTCASGDMSYLKPREELFPELKVAGAVED